MARKRDAAVEGSVDEAIAAVEAAGGELVEGNVETGYRESSAPPPETELAAAFRRQASARVSRVLEALEAVGKLAKPGTYEWTEEQEARIFEAIGNAAHNVRLAFVEARTPKPGKKAVKWEL
jgi:hypothetical protein